MLGVVENCHPKPHKLQIAHGDRLRARNALKPRGYEGKGTVVVWPLRAVGAACATVEAQCTVISTPSRSMVATVEARHGRGAAGAGEPPELTIVRGPERLRTKLHAHAAVELLSSTVQHVCMHACMRVFHTGGPARQKAQGSTVAGQGRGQPWADPGAWLL